MARKVDDVSELAASGTTVMLKSESGKDFPVPDRDELMRLMLSKMRMVECTVSIREGRQHAQFVASERFLSSKIDMHDAWEEVDKAQTSDEDRVLRAILGEALTQKIMGVEDYLYERAVHMQRKNNLLVFPRDSNNAYVKEGWNYRAAKALVETK